MARSKHREPWVTGALACRCSAETNVHKALVRVHIGTFRSGRVLGTRLQTSGTPYRDGAANSRNRAIFRRHAFAQPAVSERRPMPIAAQAQQPVGAASFHRPPKRRVV